MTDEELIALYEQLSFPSALKFKKAVKAEGGEITITAANKIAARHSQRQVTAPRKLYEGKITAAKLDSRWQADLASYVAQEAVVAGKTYTAILCVLDVFSRFLWTRRLENSKTATVAEAFQDIFTVSGRKPLELNYDKGVEFNSAVFADLLKDTGVTMVRVSDSKNDLATLDRAMSTLKTIITRRTITKDAGNWAQELEKATSSYNGVEHEHLGVAPEKVALNPQVRFQMQQQSGKDNDIQDAVTRKIDAKIDKKAGYRVEEESKLKGFAKERAFKPKYQEKIRTLASRDGRFVVDTEGERTLAARVKPVDLDATAIEYNTKVAVGSTQRDKPKRDSTQTIADKIYANLTEQTDITNITRSLTDEDNATLRRNKLTTTRMFIALHAKLFKIEGRKVSRVTNNIQRVRDIRKNSKFGKK